MYQPLVADLTGLATTVDVELKNAEGQRFRSLFNQGGVKQTYKVLQIDGNYTVQLNDGHSHSMTLRDINCSSGACQVNDVAAMLRVNLQGLPTSNIRVNLFVTSFSLAFRY